ncbi:MAG TPA: hypothetical protein VHB54_21750 [Mucilaginibacter sp.]|nr:hypothetical protein [Mucilaginibacter sp.]
MKKLLIAFLVSVTIGAYAQPQRLVALPIEMAGTALNASTLCIDFFRETPKSYHTLSSLDEGAEVSTKLGGLGSPNKAKVVGAKLKNHDPVYFGSTDADKNIPDHYKTFINDRINFYKKKYRGRPFPASVKGKLQDEVWEYNALDVYGYMPQKGNPVDNFTTARNAYIKKYGVNALDDASDMSIGLAEVKYAQKSLSHPNTIFVVRRLPETNRYTVFDGNGHLVYTGTENEDAVSSMIKSTHNDNVYLITNGFENDIKRDAFTANANLEGFKTSEKISFAEYKGQDLMIGENRCTIPKNYGPEDISTKSLNGTDYNYAKFHFHQRATPRPKGIDVDAYAKDRDIIVELEDDVNNSFSLTNAVKDMKQRISLNFFLQRFASKVKKVHNLQSNAELQIFVKDETNDVRVVKLKISKNGSLRYNIASLN